MNRSKDPAPQRPRSRSTKSDWRGPKFRRRVQSLLPEEVQAAKALGLGADEFVMAEKLGIPPERYAENVWRTPEPPPRLQWDREQIAERVLRDLVAHACLPHWREEIDAGSGVPIIGRGVELTAEDHATMNREVWDLTAILDYHAVAGRGQSTDAELIRQVWRQLAKLGHLVAVHVVPVYHDTTQTDIRRLIPDLLPNTGRPRGRAMTGAKWVVPYVMTCPRHPHHAPKLTYDQIADFDRAFHNDASSVGKAVREARALLRPPVS